MSGEPAPRPVPRAVIAERAWDPIVDRVRELRADRRFAVVGLMVVALAAGLVWYLIALGSAPRRSDAAEVRPGRAPATSPSGGRQTPRSNATTTTTVAPAGEVVAHVSGAVAREGLVRLTPGSRVADAVAAAGGAAPAADLRRVNLAAKVLDGQQVAVPAVGEPAAAATATGSGGGGSPSTDAPLDLNLATPAQLEALPGIGPSLARAIVAERERGGGFRSVDDLRRVRGIGDSRFSQLQPLVRV
jgi:competence protein ComEA